MHRFFVALAAAVLPAATYGAVTAMPPSRNELVDLSLEELSNLEITSVSKHAERLSRAPASIYVITAEDIRRSGVTSLPEALRLAPNLQVARVNTAQYSISARGFNNSLGNKLLVLIDGRTVYTPLFSGVNWDSQYVMLEDVERVEVISGPGATLWGANAVNGVINVITRNAQSTQGGLVSVGAGNLEAGGGGRYGGKFGTNGHYRVYGMGFERDNTQLTNGTNVADGLQNGQIGFRTDWHGDNDIVTVQGDGYEGRTDPGRLGPPKLSGANLLGRWGRQMAGGSRFEVQAYYDHTERDDPLTLRDKIDLFDVELRHAFSLRDSHRMQWGGGYRYARDETQTHFNSLNPLPQVFIPGTRSLHWGNVFLQDEMALRPDLSLTLGLKAESNVYTGVEWLPNARLAWAPNDDTLLWGSLSRAVRAPARLDHDFYLYLQLPPLPLIPIINGGPNFESEIAYVAETGYRGQPTSSLSFSATAFYAFYDKLRSGAPAPAMVQNMMQGSTYGVEAWGTFQATGSWRLSLGMVGLGENLRIKAASRDPTGPRALGNDPKFQWQLRSSHNLAANVELDLLLRHVTELPNPVVPAYTALDARLGWRPLPNLELSVTLRNAFDARHVEFVAGDPATAAATTSEIARGVFCKLVWRM